MNRDIPSNKMRQIYFASYYLSILLFFTASFFPDLRLWGLNCWAFLPVEYGLSALIIASLIPFLINIKKTNGDENDISDKRFYLYSILTILICTLLFYFLKAKTHFLGDGYSLIGNLTLDNTLIKIRNYGETVMRQILMDVFDGEPWDRATKSYQLVSVISGFVFLILLLLLSRKIFDNNRSSIVFTIIVITSGISLLYFGYVEHYSLFISSVMIFSITGLAIIKGKVNKIYILLIFLLSVFFHFFGLLLLPATLYILFGNYFNKVTKFFMTKNRALLLIVVLFVLLLIINHILAQYDYFFRFATLQLFDDRFTVDNYSLFSLPHLIDFFNLLFILLPSFLILIVCLYDNKLKTLQPEYKPFLFILFITFLYAAFFIDPKLGMARDWDLLSFTGIVPILLIGLLTANNKFNLMVGKNGWLLVIALNCLIIFPRVLIQVNPEFSIVQLESHLNLDRIKAKSGWISLNNYYVRSGDAASSAMTNAKISTLYREDENLDQAALLMDKKDFISARKYILKAIEYNPMAWDAYNALGDNYFVTQEPDKALDVLNIAVKLNPHSPHIRSNLGVTYYSVKNYENAIEHLNEAIKLDSTIYHPPLTLISIYITKQNHEKADYYLKLCDKNTDMPMELYRWLGDQFIKAGMRKQALLAYEYAIARGLDSTYILNK